MSALNHGSNSESGIIDAMATTVFILIAFFITNVGSVTV